MKVYKTKPEGFSYQVEVSAIYVNARGKILFLQLSDHEEETGLWVVPGGKLENRETPLEAAQRELYEETGISAEGEALELFDVLYVSKPEVNYVLHCFRLNLETIPSLSLSSEHCSYAWAAREEAEALPLLNGGKEALNAYYEN